MSEKGIVVFPPKLTDINGDLAFLAGPIKGSARWQDEAIDFLQAEAPWLSIASPRRMLDRRGDYTEEDYISQIDWEPHYLRRAADQGVVSFFFAKEETHFCERPFARTTRIEFGEWLAHHELSGTKLVVGFEDGFDGDKYIRHRLQSFPQIPVGETLEEMLQKVISSCQTGKVDQGR